MDMVGLTYYNKSIFLEQQYNLKHVACSLDKLDHMVNVKHKFIT
jgi:hypothetical protein